MFIGVYRCLQVFTGAYRCLPVFVGVYPIGFNFYMTESRNLIFQNQFY